MGVQGLTVTLTTDQAAAAIAGTSSYHGSIRVVVRNRGAGAIYLGSSSASTGSFQMSSGDQPLTFTLGEGEALYAMSTGGAAVLDVLRMNGTTST